ncbi:choline-sulfatase [Echinicola strongylocentroti]|uniref:Choline-sulfatase n=1 Tax=Echinicola strongylocentroti TaxID=1795355 RepID=A0A2Z4IPF9_9BACT|nr:sulfatase-like hydrolase/transferase [Echinicola strongylocentroti]AWW32687.1 choline-sulfatase [Echinicola strongylocentroti]
MNKLNFLLFTCAIGLLCAGCHPAKSTQKTTKPKPNVLFIFADDQRADALGCSGNGYIRTPNIDALAQRGVRFTRNYVMGGHHGAICAPSRAMLMSGKSLFHVYDKLDGVQTMPMYFNQYGYETFGTGKWHNEASSFEASFQKGKNIYVGGMADHFNVPCQDLGPDGKLGEKTKKGFSTDLFADAAIDYINEYAQGGQESPFFCYVSFTAPHDPRSPREDYIGMYEQEELPLPGNFKKAHPFKFDNMNVRDETLAPWPRSPEIIRESLADYYALMSHLDKRVGDVIQTLKDKGLYENTIIIYTADNGLAVGSHGLLGKQNLYEHSTNVPLIVSGPGIPEKETSDAFLYLYDIFPTLANLCGLPVPEEIDGTDFTDVLMGKTKQVRSAIYTVYRNTVRAVRTVDWKLINYPQQQYTQLFNLSEDPLELHNLADQHPEKVEELTELLENWHETSDDTSDLHPTKVLPMEYDYTKLRQKPDNKQPPYVLEKYFKGVDTKDKVKADH